MNQLTPHVWWLPPNPSTDRPVLGVVAGDRGALIVDAGNSPRHARLLLDAIASLHIAPPVCLALTHWHWDHVFGASSFSIPVLASAETGRMLERMAAWDWSDAALAARVASGEEIPFCSDMMRAEMPDRGGLVVRTPDVTFNATVTVHLGGVTCRILPVDGDHAAGSCIVHVPEDGVVFLGDCLGADLYHGPPHYTTVRLFPMLDRILACDAGLFVAAHDPEALTRQQMTEYAGLLRTIGGVVNQLHGDRRAVVSTLEEQFAAPLNEDQAEILEEFLAGVGR